MEDNFRITLIIISAVVIIAIFIHGQWTIRKEKRAKQLKLNQSTDNYDADGFDADGFDRNGVSKIKVKNATASAPSFNSSTDTQQSMSEHAAIQQEIPLATFNEQQPSINFGVLPNDIDEVPEHINEIDAIASAKSEQQIAQAAQILDNINDKNTATNNTVNSKVATVNAAKESDVVEQTINDFTEPTPEVEKKTIIDDTPVYQEPVIQAKPQSQAKIHTQARSQTVHRAQVTSADQVQTNATTAGITMEHRSKKEQMEIEFEQDNIFDDMPSMSATKTDADLKNHGSRASQSTTKPEQAAPEIEQQVLVVSVVVPDGEMISGAALLPTLLTLGMRYGEMNIFHRHQDNAGNGKITFSLANMMNPGTFDLDDIENFVTQGVSLFMTLPNTGNAFEVFEQMLKAAKHLAVEFKAQLLDDKRSVMTKQTEQHYVSRIREFERKSRISSF